jgi:hypothetical protein
MRVAVLEKYGSSLYLRDCIQELQIDTGEGFEMEGAWPTNANRIDLSCTSILPKLRQYIKAAFHVSAVHREQQSDICNFQTAPRSWAYTNVTST